jgi:hypothetical protein
MLTRGTGDAGSVADVAEGDWHAIAALVEARLSRAGDLGDVAVEDRRSAELVEDRLSRGGDDAAEDERLSGGVSVMDLTIVDGCRDSSCAIDAAAAPSTRKARMKF